MAPPARTADPALALFHPVVREWFAEEVGTPTDVQRRAWPEIAAGRHVLVTAPTGTGKTLAAFLWALDRFFTGGLETGATRVLYVSPLKALNTDVRRNLEEPLAALEGRFRAAGLDAPAVRALTRSGDTPQGERRRMLRHPPEILITTPESLNILLTSRSGRTLLEGLTTVILDEIHAVAGTKRGTHLITAVERVAALAGEVQRIALSATVRPLATVAELVGGLEVVGTGPRAADWTYRKRPMTVVRSEAEKAYDLRVRFPAAGEAAGESTAPGPDAPGARARGVAVPGPEAEDSEISVWDRIVPELVRRIEANRSTLVFTNSRRTTEKLTRMINAAAGRGLAYSHHGSLSREVRQVVEERLKRGDLPAIVATSSLELGIDVGALDEVILVQTPPSVASAVQRVGRAGHRVGEVSRGSLVPLYGRDFLDAAVVARSVLAREIEALHPPEAPLDVLAQVVLSMTATEAWDLEELFGTLRAMWPYRDLSRRRFDLVLEMLAGRYADSRIRELRPRVTVDRVEGTVRARPGADRLVYLSGGTIPDRGYYHLRLEGPDGARIGELDEEFVWERSVGDAFTLGTQIWRVRAITHNDVIVAPARGSAAMAPFWRADARDRGFFVSERVGRFLEEMEGRLDGEDGALLESLGEEVAMEPGAAAELVRLLRAQKSALGGRLPHRRRVVVEHVAGEEGTGTGRGAGPEGPGRHRIVLHTFWGGTVNRPFALALSAAWEERFGARPEILQDDDCLMLTVPDELAGEDLFALVPPERVEELLRRRLEATGFFGALFRQNAARALLLPRAGFRHRTPLWLTRQRSKRLLETVARYGDFPLVLETWRSCLEDELDLETLKRLLEEVRSGAVEVRHARTDAPSPFAANLLWRQTNALMYADDAPEAAGAGKGSALRADLLRELVFSPRLRPRIPATLAEELRAKLQRTAPGYAPRDAPELLDWLRERIVVPAGEWRELLAAVERDRDRDGEGGEGAEALAHRAVWVRFPGAEEPSVAALESLPRLARALATEPSPEVAAAPGSPEVPPGAPEGPDPERGRQGLPDFGFGVASLLDPEGEVPDGARENLARLPASPAEARPGEEDGEEARLGEEAEGDPLAELVGEWLRFYGPVDRGRPAAVFGLEASRLDAVLEELVEEGWAVVDELLESPEGESETREDGEAEDVRRPAGASGLQVCDAQNLETLLRWLRAAVRPRFETLPARRLPLFLAVHQGLAAPGGSLEDLQDRLERLFALPLPARAWETEVLPARLDPYRSAWLDTLLRETDLAWAGAGEGRIAFVFPQDLDLLRDPGTSSDSRRAAATGDRVKRPSSASADRAGGPSVPSSASAARAVNEVPAVPPSAPAEAELGRFNREGVDALFPDRRGRFSLSDLADHSGLGTAELTERLWELAWEGRVSNDAFEAVRKGVLRRFRPVEGRGPGASASSGHGGGEGVEASPVRGPRAPRSRRRAFDRWRTARPFEGHWYVLPGPSGDREGEGDEAEGGLDALEREELAKERARVVLERYGVVFRELLAREAPPFQWGRLFRALRLMELSGEALAGRFFDGVPGLQFASPAAFRRLREGLLPDDAVWWVSAPDPASPCALHVEGLGAGLPERRAGNHLVFHGDRPVVVSRRRGKSLEIRAAPDHPRLGEYLGFLKVLLTRDFAPRKAITVEEIDGEPASASPYRERLRELFSATVDPKGITLRRRY